MDINQSLTGTLLNPLKTIIQTIPAYKGGELWISGYRELLASPKLH